MRTVACLAVAAGLLALSVPALAGDVVAMPTGNLVPPGHGQFGWIYWDLDAPVAAAPNHANIFEGFAGVCKGVELDVLHVRLEGIDNYTEANLYVCPIPETPDRPGLIVGATNITASKWLPDSDRPTGDNRVSPFILAAYNVRVPKHGPPALDDPLIRLHAAYGWNFHDNYVFGGVQMLVHPRLGLAVFNYQHLPSYVVVYSVDQHLELRGGTKNGTAFYSAGYNFDF